MEDRIQRLELKITELENKLKEAGAGGGAGAAQNIDPEEFKTYQKVSAQLAPHICAVCTACRVCIVCQVCRVCRVCNVCINECSCGPCSHFSQGGFGDAGFGGFM